MSKLEKGQRVKLSSEGIQAVWQLIPNRHLLRGTLIRTTLSGLPVIKWDHNKKAHPFGASFVELDCPPAPRERSEHGTEEQDDGK